MKLTSTLSVAALLVAAACVNTDYNGAPTNKHTDTTSMRTLNARHKAFLGDSAAAAADSMAASTMKADSLANDGTANPYMEEH